MISFRLKPVNYSKNLTNIYKFEHTKYICKKIISMTKFEIFHIYFKTKIVGGIFG